MITIWEERKSETVYYSLSYIVENVYALVTYCRETGPDEDRLWPEILLLLRERDAFFLQIGRKRKERALPVTTSRLFLSSASIIDPLFNTASYADS